MQTISFEDSSEKAKILIQCLLMEKAKTEIHDEASVLSFLFNVETRSRISRSCLMNQNLSQ